MFTLQVCLKCSQWHVFAQGWWQTVLHCRTAVREAALSSRRSTSSSAIAEGPRNALSQLKPCQLLHKCTKNHIWLEGLPFHVV